MPSLSNKEKHTIRIAAIVLTAYLILFFGLRGWRHLEGRRAEYRQLQSEAQSVKLDLQRYETTALRLEKLRETFRIDFQKLSKATLVGAISGAIQSAAASGGVQLGPIRESAARASAKELASMQLEAIGQVAAIMGLLHKLERLGYPVLVDSISLTPDNSQPGNMKVQLTLVILDPEQWKGEPRHAKG